MESWEELSLSEVVRNFKRVRVLYNIKKTRKAGFASWEDKRSWAITESNRVDIIGSNDSLKADPSSNAGTPADLRNLRTENESTILSGASFYSRAESEPFRKKGVTKLSNVKGVTELSNVNGDPLVEDSSDSQNDFWNSKGLLSFGTTSHTQSDMNFTDDFVLGPRALDPCEDFSIPPLDVGGPLWDFDTLPPNFYRPPWLTKMMLDSNK